MGPPSIARHPFAGWRILLAGTAVGVHNTWPRQRSQSGVIFTFQQAEFEVEKKKAECEFPRATHSASAAISNSRSPP